MVAVRDLSMSDTAFKSVVKNKNNTNTNISPGGVPSRRTGGSHKKYGQ